MSVRCRRRRRRRRLLLRRAFLTAFLNTLRPFGYSWFFPAIAGVGVTDDAAGQPGSCVAVDLTLGRAAVAEVVFVRVDDDGAADNARLPVQRDALRLHQQTSFAGAIGLDVAQIARVAMILAVVRPSVIAFRGIEVFAGGRAAVGVVAVLVDVEAVKSFGEAGDRALHHNGTIGSFLRHIDDSFDEVTGQYANCFDYHGFTIDTIFISLIGL